MTIRSGFLLVLPALAAISAPACAGALGARSSGSIAISINIPPRVAVAALPAAPASRSAAASLCVTGTGLDGFHLVMVQGGTSAPAAPVMLPVAAAASSGACAPGARSLEGLAPAGRGQGTLLIVPD